MFWIMHSLQDTKLQQRSKLRSWSNYPRYYSHYALASCSLHTLGMRRAVNKLGHLSFSPSLPLANIFTTISGTQQSRVTEKLIIASPLQLNRKQNTLTYISWDVIGNVVTDWHNTILYFHSTSPCCRVFDVVSFDEMIMLNFKNLATKNSNLLGT